MASTKKRPERKAPWERPTPEKVAKKRAKQGTIALDPRHKARAKRRAARAGRSYPNLVDNMHEAAAMRAEGTKRRAAKQRSARKTAGTNGRAGATKTRTRARSEGSRAARA